MKNVEIRIQIGNNISLKRYYNEFRNASKAGVPKLGKLPNALKGVSLEIIKIR
jgi:hypothetical protein